MSLLEVDGLTTHFATDDGVVKAVDGVSLSLEKGEILGLVGESGSGKSVLGLSILRLLPTSASHTGRVRFEGQDLLTLPEKSLRRLRGDRIAMVFQDPMTSLNPFLTIERQLTEVLETHRNLSRKEARRSAHAMLERVELPDPGTRLDQYPHELSGGMRQRVMIAMALLCEPSLLIADEPTTALDVTVQAQILDMLRDLAKRSGTSIILVTHDLGVVAGLADRVAVMYAGRLVEEAPTDALFASPGHPYTRGLLACLPRLDGERKGALPIIPGLPPDLARTPPGCAFHPRCGEAEPRCADAVPPYVAARDRKVACIHAEALE